MQTANDEKGTFTEHLCYDCWANVEGNPTLKVSCKLKKGTSKWRYICPWHQSLCDNVKWEFLVGTSVDALGRLEEQRAASPEGCQAGKPWNRNHDEDAPDNGMTDEEITAFKAVEGMTAWSLEALMGIKPKFTTCLTESRRCCAMDHWCLEEKTTVRRQHTQTLTFSFLWLFSFHRTLL